MQEFKELLIEFLNSQWLVYAGYAYLFVLVMFTVYNMMNYFKYHSRMRKTLQSIYTQMTDQEKNRAQTERQERDIHGAGMKKDWLSQIDEELAYSGLKEKFRWLTTELYILFNIIVTAVLISVMTVWKGLLIGLFSAVVLQIGLKIVLATLVNQRNKKVESTMIQFMNIVDNFSKSSDDLITILDKSSRYVDDPLGSQLYDTVVTARNTGDSMMALQDLQDKVKNRQFKVLVRNLAISSRFETNYTEIIEDCREIFHEYLKNEKEKRSIRINGMLEIIAMLICGAACVFIISDITENGNLLDTLLNGGILGNGILIYLIFSVIMALYIGIFKVLKNK